MILDESLKNLHVGVRGGGNLVSHRPIFSKDSKNLFVICSNTVEIFNTESGDCTAQIQTPSSNPIANILLTSSSYHHEETLLILTESGELLHVSLDSYEFVKSENINLSIPGGWTLIRRWLNIMELRPEVLLFVGHPENEDETLLYQATRNPESKKKFTLEKICWKFLPTTHSVAVGCQGELLAAVQTDAVFMTNTSTKVSKWHKSGTRKFTCVAAHPHEWTVATGDDSGRILLWKNFLDEKSPPKTVMHWHTLPVADLCFTTDGTKILSGGSECCLLRWDTLDASDRKILPRMGLPIRHISVSFGNALVAVSHADNCIKLVDGTNNNIVRSIQNITQCYIPDGEQDENASSSSFGGAMVFTAGLHVDPNTKSLVMNGRPGHLQCYSLREDKHLYNLDITQQNYITAERKKTIPNADVTHIAFSAQGRWLATVESLLQETKYCELRLKFWKFDQVKQIFVLNTSINWPHENGVKSLKIQPIEDTEYSLMAATTGGDRIFKTWGVVYDKSIHSKSDWWSCENVGSYRDQEAGPCTFSQDGSVLAVPFTNTLTLWKTENHELTGTLCHSKIKGDITIVEFSTHPTPHLVICCTKKSLLIWDVITLSLVWTVPFEAESLAVDRHSSLVAVFSNKRHLYFFKPENPEPLAVHKNVSRSKVISSIFVSSSSRHEIKGLKSMLVFVNASQELCAMLSRDAEAGAGGMQRIKIQKGTSTLTPFAKLVAEKTVSSVRNSRQLLQGTVVGIPGSQIMDASPHTMPSVSFFCNQLLSAISVETKDSDKMDILFKSAQDQAARRKFFKRHKSPSSDSDDSDESDAEQPTQLKSVENSNPKSKTFEMDLDLASNDDTSWIKAVCE